MCLDTRFTNNADELKRRATELRGKAQELMIEAQECERMAEAESDITDSRFERMKSEFLSSHRQDHARDMNIRWLIARYNITQAEALEFLAFIGDARGEGHDNL